MMKVANKNVEELNLPQTALVKIDTKPYIVSLSRRRDDFLMWRLYNAKVALILDQRFFDKSMPNSALIKCEYVEDNFDDFRESFLRIDKLISPCHNISANTSRIATFIKHKSFETEDEVRLATWDYYDENGDKVCLADCLDNEDVVESKQYHRVKNDGKIVLYKKFKIDKQALVGIIIHTYSQLEFESIKNQIQSILIEKCFSKKVINNIDSTEAYPFNI